MNNSPTEEITLEITIQQEVTVLPRILQVLSRRGFTMIRLETTIVADSTAILTCTAEGPVRWHNPILRLLRRLVDVQEVQVSRRVLK